MKHVFIINPRAGKINVYNKTLNKIKPFMDNYDISIHKTTMEKDATNYVKRYAETHPNEEIRFYACGGDGTINEVVSGAINYPNVSVCVYPCGSGNDFVKSIGSLEFYNDIEKILNAKNKKIDVIKVGSEYYSINVCNYGFEAKVAKHANKIKKKGGKKPYLRGVIKGLFTAMKNNITVEADGEVLNPDGTLLLSSSANGGYVGGKYFCAPNYVLDDGLMEVTLVKQVSVFTLIKLIKQYELGNHLIDKRFKDLLVYKRAKKVKIYSDKPFDVCIDGEIINGKEFEIEIIKHAINFAVEEI